MKTRIVPALLDAVVAGAAWSQEAAPESVEAALPPAVTCPQQCAEMISRLAIACGQCYQH
jgi:hypothetical protein